MTLKKLRKFSFIILTLCFSIYFIGNILPNLIGVPLAFYHSYKIEQEIKGHNNKIYETQPETAIDSSLQQKKN